MRKMEVLHISTFLACPDGVDPPNLGTGGGGERGGGGDPLLLILHNKDKDK